MWSCCHLSVVFLCLSHVTLVTELSVTSSLLDWPLATVYTRALVTAARLTLTLNTAAAPAQGGIVNIRLIILKSVGTLSCYFSNTNDRPACLKLLTSLLFVVIVWHLQTSRLRSHQLIIKDEAMVNYWHWQHRWMCCCWGLHILFIVYVYIPVSRVWEVAGTTVTRAAQTEWLIWFL